MYISNWDRISQYWEHGDQQEVERFLRRICSISPQRWHSWIELYDRGRHRGEKRRWQRLPGLKPRDPEEDPDRKPLVKSAALASVLHRAGQLAPAYDRVGSRSIPILTTECVLLSIVRSFGSEIGRKLAVTGLDVARLERDALLPRHPPMGKNNS
jgi:hypothetical protein